MTKKAIKHKKPTLTFKKRYATDSLRVSAFNDPVYNIRNIYQRKASNSAKKTGGGIDYNQRNKKDGPLPLSGTYGAVNLNPYKIGKHLNSVFI
jgi:hypothetical protein